MNPSHQPAAVQTPMAPRLDLYAPIHKALRAWMFDTVVAVGRVDGSDEPALVRALAQTEALLQISLSHIAHENDFLHPLLDGDMPGSAREADVAHQGHLRHVARMRQQVQRVRLQQGAARFAELGTLYRELGLFVADNLTHMHWEETMHNEALWARHSDAELAAVHDALVQSIPPQEMAEVLRHMLPALSPLERHGMLTEMRAQMPAGAFDGVLQLAHEVLDVHAWAELLRVLQVQPSLPHAH